MKSSVGLTDKGIVVLAALLRAAYAGSGRTVKIGAVDTPALEYHGKTLNLDFTVVDEFTGPPAASPSSHVTATTSYGCPPP